MAADTASHDTEILSATSDQEMGEGLSPTYHEETLTLNSVIPVCPLKTYLEGDAQSLLEFVLAHIQIHKGTQQSSSQSLTQSTIGKDEHYPVISIHLVP